MLLWAVVWFRRISSRHQCYRTDIRLSARVIPIVVYKKLWNAIDPVLGEIRNKRFQRRRKKLETVDKTQISQREADVPFRVVGDTRNFFFQTVAQHMRIDIAHIVQNYRHELVLFAVQVAMIMSHAYKRTGHVVVVA